MGIVVRGGEREGHIEMDRDAHGQMPQCSLNVAGIYSKKQRGSSLH